jgi:allantoicase
LRLFVDGQYEDYALIQIHNGADVRGGYTDAKLFKGNEWSNYISEYMSQSEIEDDLEYITVVDEHGVEYTAEELNLITSN